MRIIVVVLLLSLQGIISCASGKQSDVVVLGRLVPEAFGAKGDGLHDDTRALQTALDSLDQMGGGALYLGSGTYMVSSIRLGKKTSLIGCGNGATLIKQIKGVKADCVIVQAKSAALRISNLSIVGNDVNIGLMIEDSSKGYENHPYLYNKAIKDGVPQPYKWMTIDDICIYHFETGLNIYNKGYNINICNSTFSHNGVGVVMKCTDSSMYNCYVTNNKKDGLQIVGSNNKISNVKSIFNGGDDPKETAAIRVNSSRCQIANCETQDNYCKGFCIAGQSNLISNCISNTDGYTVKGRTYNPAAEATGFMISGLYNVFSNCAVTSYIQKYGAVYYMPVRVDESVAYYYPDIFTDIKVLIPTDKMLFNEPYRNVQSLACKNQVLSVQKEYIDNREYFVSSTPNHNIIKNLSLGLSSLNLLTDFRCKESGGDLISIRGTKTLTISLVKRSLCLLWNGQKKAELVLDEDAILNQDDMRLILSFAQYGQKLTVSMLCYEKTQSRGWIKKEVRHDVEIPALFMNNADVRIGDTGVAVKRLAVTNCPLPESVFLPYSNTNRIYDGSTVYVDADSAM